MIVVARPVQQAMLPCTAPPPDQKEPILAGIESALPETEGVLHLVAASLDDRLASPGPRAVAWGDGGRLLTVERDRAIVWELATGHAVASARLPGRIYTVEALTATPDLSRAAALVREELPDGAMVTRILGIQVATGEARLLETRSSRSQPFSLSSDGAWLIVGGDVWSAETLEAAELNLTRLSA
jgi:hypothetical protein